MIQTETDEPQPTWTVTATDAPSATYTLRATQSRHGDPRFYQLLDEIAELHSRKNHDYAKTEEPLSNFNRSKALGIEPWRGVLIRMSDKWSRLEQLASGKTPKNESMRDTLIDLAVYALIDVLLLEDQS